MTSDPGKGNGNILVGLAILSTHNSTDILTTVPSIVIFKDGTKINIPLFVCDNAEDVSTNVGAAMEFYNSIKIEEVESRPSESEYIIRETINRLENVE